MTKVEMLEKLTELEKFLVNLRLAKVEASSYYFKGLDIDAELDTTDFNSCLTYLPMKTNKEESVYIIDYLIKSKEDEYNSVFNLLKSEF